MTSARDDELLEKAAIRETLLRYAAGIDRRDWDLMLSCFTEDVWAIFQATISGVARQDLAYITLRRRVSIARDTMLQTCTSN